MTQPLPAHLFQPGNKKGGRPKGSRQKLSTSFFNDFYAVWEEQGEAVIRRAFFESPVQALAIAAKLMPQKIELTTPTDGMTPERFEELLDLAERMARLSADKAMEGSSPPMTIEGTAVMIEGGGGSPQDADARGEVIEVVHTSASEPIDLIAVEAPQISGGPIGDPPSSITALTLDEDDDIDPASLF